MSVKHKIPCNHPVFVPSLASTLPTTLYQHVAEEEKAWFEREAAANEKALRCMRSLMPVGVTELTVSELEQRAIDGGSLYPRDLSLRLKVTGVV